MSQYTVNLWLRYIRRYRGAGWKPPDTFVCRHWARYHINTQRMMIYRRLILICLYRERRRVKRDARKILMNMAYLSDGWVLMMSREAIK